MASKFNMMDLLSQKSKEISQQVNKITEVDSISSTADIYDLVPSKDNFYNTESIEDLKQSIELLGVLQPLAVHERENGKYKIIAGHRRSLAVRALVEEGKEEFRLVPIMIKPKKNNILDRLALIMANRFRDKTDWERMTETLETEALVLELKETMDIPGRTRDLLAEIVKTSPAQAGRYKAINNNLINELMAEFKNNNIGVSVVYEISGLAEEYQRKALEEYKNNGLLTISDIKALKMLEEADNHISSRIEENTDKVEKVENVASEGAAVVQEEFEPQPNKITSICYSCSHWNECDIKSNTVTDCGTYKSKAEAEKSDEQRYEEEQEKINKQTEKILRKQEDEEKMQHLPSEQENKEHEIMLATSCYDDISSGRMTFQLLKSDNYRVGEVLHMIEYAEGERTGRKITTTICYVLEEYKGLEEGYCIVGINILDCD